MNMEIPYHKSKADTTQKIQKEFMLKGKRYLVAITFSPHFSGIDAPKKICEEFIVNYERWIKGEPLIGLVDRNKGY